jgi:DNA-directed RNA polymerase specialized sigma24 family protein
MSCEEKMPEYYRHAKESLRKSRQFSDLIRDEQTFKAAVKDVMDSFEKANHSEGVDNPKAYIGKTAYLVLVNLLKMKKKRKKKDIPAKALVPFDEEHRYDDSVREMIFDFEKNGTLTPEDWVIIKDCIDQLSTVDKALYYDYFPSGYTMREAGPIWGVSYGAIKDWIDPIFRKVQDCIFGRTAH